MENELSRLAQKVADNEQRLNGVIEVINDLPVMVAECYKSYLEERLSIVNQMIQQDANSSPN